MRVWTFAEVEQWSSESTVVRPGASALQPTVEKSSARLFWGFTLLHPAWMGRIEWFRRCRYDESIPLAEDQQLLLRSHRNSRFANLPQIVLCYREERITLEGTPLTRCLHAAQS